MNNVVNMHNLPMTPARQQYFQPDSPLYFDTFERPAGFQGRDSWHNDPKHKYIVRMVDDQPVPIGLVGKDYKVIKTQEICESVEDTFVEVLDHEQLKDVTRSDETAYHGGLSYRQYVFPSITADIGSKRSDIAFRTVIVNGYDGASSFKFFSGAIDFFCTNGMVTGVFDISVNRHTQGFTMPKFTDRLRKSIDIFYTQADQWKHWVGKEITDELAKEAFEAIPNASEKLVSKLMRQFHIEALEHGRTVWALYSAATYYATHSEGEFKVRETAQDHSASTLMNREKQVRSWISTDEFEKIAA